MLVVTLETGETITAESGAMTYMGPNIDVHTRMREKSFLGTLGLTFLDSQSFFVNDYTAASGVGEAGFVSAPVGDIDVLEVSSTQGYIVQKSSYVASTKDVNLDIQWQGFTKGLFGQGLFMIKGVGKRNTIHKHVRRHRQAYLEGGRENDCGQLPLGGFQ